MPATLTRLGRLAALVILSMAMVLVGVSVAAGGGSTGAAGGSQRAVTVAPGQTLSHVAAAHLPQVPLASAVAMIQLANDLSSPQVQAGQLLVIPPVP